MQVVNVAFRFSRYLSGKMKKMPFKCKRAIRDSLHGAESMSQLLLDHDSFLDAVFYLTGGKKILS